MNIPPPEYIGVNNRYKLDVNNHKLGSGSYGIVFRYMDTFKNNEPVAVKRYLPQTAFISGPDASMLREVTLLQNLSHEHIVCFKDFFTEPLTKEQVKQCKEQKFAINIENASLQYQFWSYLVMEKLSVPLNMLIDNDMYQKVTHEQIRSWLHQLMQAVYYLHQQGIVHRDIKPQNIMLTFRNNLRHIKLGDFGLGRLLHVPSPGLSEHCCTLYYRSPEMLLGQRFYAMPLDMWSLGMVFAEFIYGHPFLTGEGQFDQLFLIFQYFGTPCEQTWPGVTKLPHWNSEWPSLKEIPWTPHVRSGEWGFSMLDGLLTCDPTRRITARDALYHPLFATVPHLLDESLY